MENQNQSFTGKHILIVIENLPAPFDRRVWQEANSLKNQGAEVSIICPRFEGYTKPFETINGIDIYRHPMVKEGDGFWGYLNEYTTAIFWEIVYSIKLFSKKRFHIIQGCNPPDLIFLTALLFKPFGVKYIFDHHDINPELYVAKFNKKGFFHNVLLFLERITFATADFSISTNESYKEIAIVRGKMKPEDVQVVRSGPKIEKFKITEGKASYKKGRNFLVGYVGVIGMQEGLDLLMESVKYIVSKRQDIQFAIIGSGTHLDEIKSLVKQLQLEQFVDFYGRVSDEILLDVLNTADVCVNPDTPNEMNNLSTMNKIMEYMALKKPIVQFDLKEGRHSAANASLYAANNDTIDFAEKILYLIDNELIRKEMGEYGYQRVMNELCWDVQEKKLISLYKKAFASK